MKEQNCLTLRNVFGDLIDYTPMRTSFRYMFRRESQKGTKSFRSIVLDSKDYLQFEDDGLKQELEQKKAVLRNLKTSFFDMYKSDLNIYNETNPARKFLKEFELENAWNYLNQSRSMLWQITHAIQRDLQKIKVLFDDSNGKSKIQILKEKYINEFEKFEYYEMLSHFFYLTPKESRKWMIS